jgi:hypothetical protein
LAATAFNGGGMVHQLDTSDRSPGAAFAPVRADSIKLAGLSDVCRALTLAIPVLIALQAIFAFSLVAVRSHTDISAINNNIRVAFDQGVLATDQVPKLWILRGGHRFTECVALNVALDPQPNPWESALAPELHFHMVDACVELYKTVSGENAELMDYSRYWHGYRLLLWPVLQHADVLTLRAVTALLVAIGCALFFFGLRATIGLTPALILLATLFLLTDLWHIWRVATHGLSMFVILGGTGVFALLIRRWTNQYLWIVTAAALGAIFNFIDFLINPPMMPMLMSFIVLAFMSHTGASHTSARERPGGLRPPALAAAVAASWFFGYALTWATKWALAIWLSNNAPQEATGIIHQVIFRLYGLEPGSTMFRIPLVPTITMIATAFESFGTIVAVAMIAAIVVHVRNHRLRFDRARFYQLISPLFITFIWFELLSNHTQLHPNFVYRSASTAVAIVLAAAIIATDAPATLVTLWINLRRHVRSSILLLLPAKARHLGAWTGNCPVPADAGTQPLPQSKPVGLGRAGFLPPRE